MDQRARPGGRRRLGDVPGAVHMEALEVALQDSDQVDHRACAGDGALDARALANIGGNELELADPAERLEEVGAAGIALGDTDAPPALDQVLDDIAANEAAPTEDGDEAFGAIDHEGRIGAPAPGRQAG